MTFQYPDGKVGEITSFMDSLLPRLLPTGYREPSLTFAGACPHIYVRTGDALSRENGVPSIEVLPPLVRLTHPIPGATGGEIERNEPPHVALNVSRPKGDRPSPRGVAMC